VIQFEPPYPNGYYYTSHEFIMEKEHFKGLYDSKDLYIRQFEEAKIDDYALLLDNAMVFVSPPPNFQGDKEKLAENIRNKVFFAFYIKNDLVGVYWLDNDLRTIEYIAISPNHQRKGYGSIILSHSLHNVFFVQNKNIAKLYCVDWNENGIKFYKKFGMVLKGHIFSMILK
jgi:RimJ/RimL family protein N-acetyltransferase